MKNCKFLNLSIHPSSVHSSLLFILVFQISSIHQYLITSTEHLNNHLIKAPQQCFCFGINNVNCVSTNFMVRVIASDFQFDNQRSDELNWRIVNLTSILINQNVDKLVHDLASHTYRVEDHQVTTIDLRNDQNEYLQPIHIKNYLSFSEDDLFNKNLYYWQSPEQYVGNKLYSYGNELQFKLSYSVLRGDVASNKCNYERDADVLIAGVIENRIHFLAFKWTRYQNKFRCDIPITIRIQLKEQFWHLVDDTFKVTNQTVNRLHFALILNSLRLLLIRASYHSDQIEARLYTVTMGLTDPTKEVKIPYQAKTVDTCVNCSENTSGLFCERCKMNFYGNPIVGDSCKPCECPNVPYSSKYHADGCVFDKKRNRQICKCKKGYIGERCDHCDINYYGDPNKGECRVCNCNGNVDFSDVGVCDVHTGKCLKCLFNTQGDHCEKCKVGYFGDALKQSCRPCSTCNWKNWTDQMSDCENRIHHLNHSITSDHCDSCPRGYYKKYSQIVDENQKVRTHFTCEQCNCSPIGSLNNGDCHQLSGKCFCRIAFTGLKCDQCAVGYEKYGLNCVSCNINQTNDCINGLRNEIQKLQDISRDYSFDTLKALPVIKLNNFKDQINKQRENVDYWIEYEQRVNQVINNVSKLIPDLSGQFAMNADVLVSLCNRAESTIEKAIETANTSDGLFLRLRFHYKDLSHIINVVNATRKVNLNTNQCDLYLEQSHSMVIEIKQIGNELNEFQKSVEEMKIESENLLQNVKNFNKMLVAPLDSELFDRMLRLTNISFDSFEIYEKQFSRPYLQTLGIIENSNQLYDQVQEIIANASVSINEMNMKLNESFSKLELAKQNLTFISTLFEQFPGEFNNLKTNTIEKLKNTLIRIYPQNEEKYASICQNHANELVNKAKQLRLKFNSTLSSASKYQNQTTENSYKRITEIIRNIQENVNEIEEILIDLQSQIYSEKETDEQAGNRNKKSKQLLEQAETLSVLHLKDIQTRLDQSREQIEMIQNKTFIIDEANNNIKKRNTILLEIEYNLKELANKSQMFKGINERFPNTNNLLNAYNEKINKFNNTIIQDYLPRINNLKSRKALLDGNFIGEIDKIKTNIENKSKYVKSFEIRNHKMENLHREMHRNLNEIITKIRLARQKAASIRISIRNHPIIEIRNLTIATKNLTTLKRITNESISSMITSSINTQSSPVNPLLNNPTSASTIISNTTIPTSTPALPTSNENQIFQQQSILINCKRSYDSELEPSSVNTISLIFSINEMDKGDSLILYVGSKYFESSDKFNDFFVVEMVNRRIRFIWNSGSGIQVLEHPTKIQLNNLNLSNKDHWYKVQVLRLASTTHLQVKPLSDKSRVQELSATFYDETLFEGKIDLFESLDSNQTLFTSDQIIRTKSLGSSIRMDFDKNTEILIGSLPDNWIERKDSNSSQSNELDYVFIPAQILSRKMAGCLFELNLDGHEVNLWKFKTTTAACVGCQGGISEERPSNEFRFEGKFSYAMLPQISRYNSLKYTVQLNIRTYDENALLFFTCNPTTGDHIVLTLVDGRIRFQVVSRNSVGQYIGIDLTSREKYNSGAWISIAAERDNLEGILQIDNFNELLNDTIHLLHYSFTSYNVNYNGNNFNEKFNANYNSNLEQTVSVPVVGSATTMFTNSRQLKLDLGDQYLFIGGIPLNYSSNQCSNKLPTFKSFTGCMKNILIDSTTLNLLNQVYYGVDNDCFDQVSSRSISFNADAYMEFDGQSLDNQAEISFTFKTLQANATILLSMFNKRDFQDRFESYYLHNHYRILMRDGFILVNLKASSDSDRTLVSRIILESKTRVNDNQFHTLALIKRQRKIILYIDDEECGTLRFKRKVLNVRAAGSLYVGGIPTNFQPTEDLEIKQAFNGTIKDIVFNRKLMDLNRKIFFV